MSTDRPVTLNTGIAQQFTEFSQTRQHARQDASDTDRRAFEQAMNKGGSNSRPGEQTSTPPSPFALLGSMPATPLAATPEATQAREPNVPPRLTDTLNEAATRLLVSDGRSGRREVRIALKDELLPGVTVSIYEDEGRLTAHFICAIESSRERLCSCAYALADALAESLSRPTLVRITTDDPEDPCLTEVPSGTDPA